MSGLARKLSACAAVGVTALGLTGCTSTIHKRAAVDGIQTLSIDAKQRLMLVGRHPQDGRPITCTEPSPDALVAAAAAASGRASGGPTTNPVAGALSLARTESAASIGLRTQPIQLMRDGYFRLCEGLMNGVIDQRAYTAVVKDIDLVMAVVMGIDALGGTERAPGVAITAGSISGSATDTTTDTTTTAAAGSGGTIQIEQLEAPKGMDAAQANAIRDIVIEYMKLSERRPY